MIFRLLLCFTCITHWIGEAEASSAKRNFPPSIEIPARHIRFQAGKLGDKPWHYNASFGVMVNFFGAISTKLLYVDSDYKIHPGVFKDWKWDYKTKSFTFSINENLKFSSNRQVKPEDIEFALLKSFLGEIGKPYRDRLRDIVGIENLQKHKTFKSGMCPGIKIIGKNKLQVFLKKENPHFLYSLVNGVPPISPIEDFEKDLFSFKKVPEGTGSYFVEWSDPKSSLVRLKIKDYDKEKLKAENYPLTIDFINEGQPKENNVDLATAAGSSGIREDKDYTTKKGSIPEAIFTLDFNFTHKLSKNRDLRKAIALAINRDLVHVRYIQTNPTNSLVPSKYLGHEQSNIRYSPSESKKIVNTKLKGISSEKKPLKGIYHGVPGSEKKPHIIAIEQHLKAAGIYIDFKPVSVLIQFGDNKDAFIKENGNSVSFVDPLSSISRFIPFEGEENLIANADDKRLLKLFREAEKAETLTKKSEFIKKLSNTLTNNFYTIPIGEGYPIFSYNSRIQDIGISKIFASVDFKNVKLKKVK